MGFIVEPLFLRGGSSSRANPQRVPPKSTSTPITSTITFSGGLT
jgi:hypothetical protein